MMFGSVVDLVPEDCGIIAAIKEFRRLDEEGANAPDWLIDAKIIDLIDFVPGRTNWETHPAKRIVKFKPKEQLLDALDDMRQQLRWKQY